MAVVGPVAGNSQQKSLVTPLKNQTLAPQVHELFHLRIQTYRMELREQNTEVVCVQPAAHIDGCMIPLTHDYQANVTITISLPTSMTALHVRKVRTRRTGCIGNICLESVGGQKPQKNCTS